MVKEFDEAALLDLPLEKLASCLRNWDINLQGGSGAIRALAACAIENLLKSNAKLVS
mgnify:CR=1 FL=1